MIVKVCRLKHLVALRASDGLCDVDDLLVHHHSFKFFLGDCHEAWRQSNRLIVAALGLFKMLGLIMQTGANCLNLHRYFVVLQVPRAQVVVLRLLKALGDLIRNYRYVLVWLPAHVHLQT